MAEDAPAAREPAEITEEAVEKGEEKADLSWTRLLVLGLLAGAFIAFGSLFSTLALAGAEAAGVPHGLARIVSGVAFSLGLVLVVLAGAELFTGNTLMVVAWAEGRAGAAAVSWALALAWATNLLASLAVVWLAILGGVHLAGDGAVGAAAVAGAADKLEKGFGAVLASGVLANALVCLAVWMAWGAKSAADKVLVIVLPITAFVALGLEHSVANMSLLPLGLWSDGAAWRALPAAAGAAGEAAGLSWGGVWLNLLASTLGNMAGGALVGGAYWLAYRRGDGG